MSRPFCCGLCLIGIAAFTLGCSSTKQSNTARTAREQLLVSNAIDQSLSKVDFTPFQGSRVFVDDKYLDCVDKGYLVGSVRHRAMANGAVVVNKIEDADVVMELRSGVIGTDMADSFLGTPEIVLPGMLTIPEVRLVNRTRQSAMAKIGLVAYDPKSMAVLGQGGVSSSQSEDNNWFVMGVGPWQSGSVRDEVRHSVPVRPNQPYQPLPVSVAFQEPERHPAAPGKLQLTGEQSPADAKPAETK
jgi:hypothetical protein